MSKRYTDIDALVAMLQNNNDLPFNGGDSWAHIVQIKDKLIEHIEKNAPVADVVEVVRCEKCKYNASEKALIANGVWCEYWGFDPAPNDFCRHGERKDGADNAAD